MFLPASLAGRAFHTVCDSGATCFHIVSYWH